MTQGKRIGIHNNSACPWICQQRNRFCSWRLTGFRLKLFQIISKAGTPVFHKHDLSLNPGDFVESQIAKKFGSAAFGIKEQTGIAYAVLVFHKMR